MKKKTKAILGFLFIALLTLMLTVPSNEDYYAWLEDEYNIQESKELYYYEQGDKELFHLGTHERTLGLFSVRQNNFEYTVNGKVETDGTTSTAFRDLEPEEGLTIRTLEIGTMIFNMDKDNILWRIFM